MSHWYLGMGHSDFDIRHSALRSARNPFRATSPAESFPPSPFIGHECCVAKPLPRVGIRARHTAERHYDISDLAGQYARSHWGIENKLHGSLDATFREDALRNRIGHSAENFSRIRRLSLNLLRREKTFKGSLKSKRLRAGLREDYLTPTAFCGPQPNRSTIQKHARKMRTSRDGRA